MPKVYLINKPKRINENEYIRGYKIRKYNNINRIALLYNIHRYHVYRRVLLLNQKVYVKETKSRKLGIYLSSKAFKKVCESFENPLFEVQMLNKIRRKEKVEYQVKE